ncbi:SMC-Scp complex subunit ScpB [Candidatus Kuenenbacteria bacterium]|nr:SMC-Scp complex subunit ScpB [Candidatus Kuenenbacteria bacterium]
MKTKIESLLFISSKPLTSKWLASFLTKHGEKVTKAEVDEVLTKLKECYNIEGSGIQIIQSGDDVQMVSSPDSSELVKKFLKDDMTGELTPASLEALTVIAYRGPISKAELEQIRGVNCSLILRNLMIRGLISVEEDKNKAQSYYQATTDFLKHLGLNSVEDMPDYDRLHQVENLEQYLEKAEEKNEN